MLELRLLTYFKKNLKIIKDTVEYLSKKSDICKLFLNKGLIIKNICHVKNL
ncbi:hypothetical protein J2W55_005243 [Mucilaginibacter pocheonensis]|uniref:Uncharacterized protein n=1 Tax=Mucilaginibacter pocheonensis TaxID=398050 RepID=A0ABU1TJD2_9SPHI|nr:hypothetical protein [Mucilaginibacter pocheonensis]